MRTGHVPGRFLAALTAATGGLGAGLLAVGPAQAAPLPDLKVTVAITPGKAAYSVGDTITAVYTIRNVSAVAATGIRSGGTYDGLTWIGDMPWSAAFDLAPGASRTFTWAAKVSDAGSRGGYAAGRFEFEAAAGDADPADDLGTFRLPVPGGKGTMRLKVFVDAKGDSSSEQPGLAGAEVVLSQPKPGGARVAGGRTDAKGWVSFTGLATQDYRVSVPGRKLAGDNPDSTSVEVMADQTATAFVGLLPGAAASGSPGASSDVAAPAGASPSGTPALAVTGSNSGTVAVVGGIVVLAGAGLFLMARHRRRRFVA
ncbi:hypothetical protein ACWT_0856 [Actinoplanes sp. SE50]|uniref:LPXTG cell wall anchor domain-containing protein n=1 Tax=unclassified Actinoplanes TaxID=2626549 RepID=UPI00023EC1F6|nr:MULTISPECIES: LPXTG cell wall anchor domain-containing protein [unclassified Actinoplanes]AEV81870.1 hypothetical protein ACPL_973 [Actinoplanes sp. SE50/110]ATO80271.1 hypothetical protein ACWT_0856 [Actinoplanes sp. SE50]SLL97676.1 hypothetical protein ACSP50_0885 [Actinoplanes sp. SE50/110]